MYAIKIVTTIPSIIDNTKYHQNDGEHFEITHKFALLSKISLCRDFYVIRWFRSTLPLRSLLNECHWHSATSVEGLTAYRSLAVPGFIFIRTYVLSRVLFPTLFQLLNSTKTSQNICPGRPCSTLRRLDRILLYPINVWVTENGGNTGIPPEFVADALQTVED